MRTEHVVTCRMRLEEENPLSFALAALIHVFASFTSRLIHLQRTLLWSMLDTSGNQSHCIDNNRAVCTRQDKIQNRCESFAFGRWPCVRHKTAAWQGQQPIVVKWQLEPIFAGSWKPWPLACAGLSTKVDARNARFFCQMVLKIRCNKLQYKTWYL